MADKKRSGGYIAPCNEWERTEPSPGGDPFGDPDLVDEALEKARHPIQIQPHPEVPDA